MQPQAFVYTELQVSLPFTDGVWRDLNPVLRQQQGLLSKTWLSGHGNQSVGGLYAFASLSDAQRFALEFFPGAARRAGAAFTVRVFDATVAAAASRDLGSPFFA